MFHNAYCCFSLRLEQVCSDLWTRLMSGEVTSEGFLPSYIPLKNALEERKTKLLQRYEQMKNKPDQLGEALREMELVDLEHDIKELEDSISGLEQTVSKVVKECAGVPGPEYPGETVNRSFYSLFTAKAT